MSRFVRHLALGATICLSTLTSSPAAEQEIAAHPLPTSRQWKILAAFDEATEIDMADQPLADVIEYWKTKHDVDIQLDSKALGDSGIGIDTPITIKVKGIRLRSALRLVLRPLDLTYIVGDGYLLITTKTEAENSITSRIYPVQDLVTLNSEFRPPLEPGEKTGADFRSLIELIMNTAAPTTWDEVGGPGGIQEFAPSRALAISQTEEVHEEIAEVLAALRHARDKQLRAAKPVAFVAQHRHADKGPLETNVYRLVRRASGESQASADGNGAQVQPDAAAANKPAKEAEKTAGGEKVAGEKAANENLDACAKAIAELVPQMIEPANWEPSSGAMIRAVGETIVVRQTGEVQGRIGKLINEIFPGSVPASLRGYYPAVGMSALSVQGSWPHEAEPSPGPIEARITETLDETTEIEVAEQPLSDVMNGLSKQHDLQIQLDEKALSDAGVSGDTPITRTIHGLRLRTALRLILDELDLTTMIRNDVLLVTSKTEAENMLTIKIYPVFDLVVRSPDAPTTRPGLDFQPLVDNILGNIAPTTWDTVGGPGAIMPFTNCGAIVISQTTEAHEEIAQFLQALREVGRAQK